MKLVSNPKDLVAIGKKIPVHLWPPIATILGALGLSEGEYKYGRNNFRAAPVLFTVYYDALQRHAFELLEGFDLTGDTYQYHLANMLACLGILADSWMCGTLIDDRNYKGRGYRKAYQQCVRRYQATQRRLRKLFPKASPRHFTIKDNRRVR